MTYFLSNLFRISVLLTVFNLPNLTSCNPVNQEAGSSLPHRVEYKEWYTYDVVTKRNPAWSRADRNNPESELSVTGNPWILYKSDGNRKNITKLDRVREDNSGSNNSNKRYTLVISNNNKNRPEFLTTVDSYSSPAEPKRKSEIKCEQYGDAVGRKVWALPLVGAEPEGISVGTGSSKCKGLHTPLIVGGTKAQPGEFPHMAALGWSSDEGVHYYCGGTLISENWVLTAAHCTHGQSGSPSVVRLGSHVLSNNSLAQVIEIERIRRHPTYKPPAMYADIALLKLGRSVQFRDHIRPACLYPEYDAVPPQALVTGWGITQIEEDSSEILLKARLDILDNLVCALQHNRSAAIPRGVVPSMICAGDASNDWQSDTCQGDSGGPLQVIHPTISCLYQLVGITSFGKLCAVRDSPGVYTRVSHYLDWIERIVWPDTSI